MSLSRFDAVASQYDAGRPGYPDALYDAIEDLWGAFLDGARTADVCAGTGISTRGLASRGARVVALDHGAQMLQKLQARTPIPAALADANALPIADDALDLVTFAQAWHWVDRNRAPAEVRRVLRPGGALAVWWNVADEHSVQWLAEHRARLREVGQDGIGLRFSGAWDSLPSLFPDVEVGTARLAWERLVTKDVVLDEVASKSYVAALAPNVAAAFLDRERDLLPDGPLTEPFVTQLAVVSFPKGAR